MRKTDVQTDGVEKTDARRSGEEDRRTDRPTVVARHYSFATPLRLATVRLGQQKLKNRTKKKRTEEEEKSVGIQIRPLSLT